MVSPYLAPTHPQPCSGGRSGGGSSQGGSQGGSPGGGSGQGGDLGGGDRGGRGGLPLTELQIGYDSTRRVHLAAGQALFNVPRRTAARLPLALATPTAACAAGGGGAAGGGAVAVASALALLGPAGREMMRDLAGAAELPSGKGVDSGWGERRP